MTFWLPQAEVAQAQENAAGLPERGTSGGVAQYQLANPFLAHGSKMSTEG